MSEPIAFLNDRLVPFSQATLSVTDLGVVAGASVTEMIRTFRHVPFRLSDHLDRLFGSLELCGFLTKVDRALVESSIAEVVTHNSALIPVGHDLGIIVFVTAGQNLTYLGSSSRDSAAQGTVCVHTFPLPFELWAGKHSTGQHLASVSVEPLPSTSIPPQAKHRNRLHWFRADKEARSRFPAASSLLATTDGQITETSSGNFFITNDRTIRTALPELVLSGISQKVLRELATGLGFDWQESSISLDDLAKADEALTSSTTYCLLPVTRFNDRPVGSGHPGPVFRELMAAWSDLVGVDIVRQAAEAARERCG
ncbi:MAG: aminotransferase class IV [Planctomycetota bacterium]|nr:aminotransferase class IV [Planctomycetota bacterium]